MVLGPAPLLLLGLSLAFAAEATELDDGTVLFGEHNPMPAAVLALQDCEANERSTPAAGDSRAASSSR